MVRSRWGLALAIGLTGCQLVLGIDEDSIHPARSSDGGDAAPARPTVEDAGGSSCALPPDPRELWVDGRATVPETGASACPFRTITAALQAASTSTATNKVIHVAEGTYGPGETLPLTVRGLTLEGAGSARTVVRGLGVLDHSAASGQFPDLDLRLTVLIGHETEASALSGFTLQPAAGLPGPVLGYFGVLCDKGNTPDAIATPLTPPNTTLRDLVVGPNYEAGVVSANSQAPARSGCNMAVTASTFDANAAGVWVLGCGRTGTGDMKAALRLGDGTTSGANTFRNHRMDYAGDPNGGRGAFIWDCVHTFAALTNTFEGNDRGIQVEQNSNEGRNRINGNVFRNQRYYGVYMVRRPDVEELLDNRFEGTVRSGPKVPTTITGADQLGAGIRLIQPFSVPGAPVCSVKKARRNTFVGNEIGVLIQAAIGAPMAASDFGQDTDPGDNTFACNSSQHPLFPRGGDVIVQAPAVSGVFRFRHNRWDHGPPTTFTGGSPPDGIDVARPPAIALEADDASASASACAPTFTRGP